MSDNIFKIWGKRRRIHLDYKNEIDLLHIKKDTFCSTHTHNFKANKFVLVSGKVRIESEYGSKTLEPNEIWIINAPIKHRFYAEEDSIMIEFAYVKQGIIDPDDINRESQGGRVINSQEMTLDEMREKGYLDL